MAEIFVSYRRDDTGILCERVTGRLTARFGEKRVFRDAAAIFIGSKWEKTLRDALEDCYVVIALIGAHWLDARDAQGQLRLFDPHDFVRMELATALAQRKRIVPVLANGARMPLPHELPPDLAPLARIPALVLRPDPHFDADMQAIIDVTAPGVQRRIPHPLIMLCGLLGLGAEPLFITALMHNTILLDGMIIVLTFALTAFSLLALLIGCLLAAIRSVEARAWLWLAPAALVFTMLAVCVTDVVIVVSTLGAPGLAIGFRYGGIIGTFFSSIIAIALTLAFSVFGPRRLSRFRTPPQQLRPMRWIAGTCAALSSLAFAPLGLFIVGASDSIVLGAVGMSVAPTLVGLAMALSVSVRQKRWWWVGGLLAAAVVVMVGFLASQLAPLSDDVAYNVFAFSSGVGISVLDFFALRSDRGLRGAPTLLIIPPSSSITAATPGGGVPWSTPTQGE